MSFHPATNEADAMEASTSVGQHENRQAIADRLEALAIELRTLSDQELVAIPTEQTLVALAQKIYSARRKTDDIIGIPGFAISPAWDILLDLYQARFLGKEVSVTSACIGGACPPTTGLRWLQVLDNTGLIIRRPDRDDKRRFVVEITDAGLVKVERALAIHL